MRKEARTLFLTAAMVTMIGGIFFAAKPQAPVDAQTSDEFYLYQLQIYCDPRIASVILTARGSGTAGTKVICAGNCAGRTDVAPIMVSLDAALAGLPAKVGAALRAEVQKHEEAAGAGNGRSLAECLGKKENADDSKCDKKKACDALKAIDQLIGRYKGKAGYYFGSFSEFNQKLGPLLQKLSEALTCRFNPGHDQSDAAILNDYVGQMLKDKNSFKSLTPRSQMPQATSCKSPIASTVDTVCSDFNAIDRIKSNAATLASAIGCEAPPQDVPPAKKDCKELSNGILDGLTTFFDQVKETQSRTSFGSGDAYDQVSDGIKGSLDELEDAAKEIEGAGGSGAQQYKDIQEKISKLKKLLDVWSQIKSASCLPPEVEQLLRRLAEEKKGGQEYKATCTELCAATADWYVKISGLSAQRGTFFKACTLACF